MPTIIAMLCINFVSCQKHLLEYHAFVYEIQLVLFFREFKMKRHVTYEIILHTNLLLPRKSLQLLDFMSGLRLFSLSIQSNNRTFVFTMAEKLYKED